MRSDTRRNDTDKGIICECVIDESYPDQIKVTWVYCHFRKIGWDWIRLNLNLNQLRSNVRRKKNVPAEGVLCFQKHPRKIVS